MLTEQVKGIVRTARRIAVVGLGNSPWRPAYGVASYLQAAGYTILPVHPSGESVLGQPAHRTLLDAARAGPIDIVDVFRRSEAIPDLVPDCVAVRPLLVWLQVGIRHDAAARQLEAAGISVVQNRCLAVDHQLLVT